MQTENEVLIELGETRSKMWVSSDPEQATQIAAQIAEAKSKYTYRNGNKGRNANNTRLDNLISDLAHKIPARLIVKDEALKYVKLDILRHVAQAQGYLADQRKRMVALLTDGERMLTHQSYYVNDLVNAEATWQCWHDIYEAVAPQATLTELRAELKTLTDKINANAWRYADQANRLDVDSAVSRRWAEILHGIAENRLPWTLDKIDEYIKAPATVEELAQQVE